MLSGAKGGFNAEILPSRWGCACLRLAGRLISIGSGSVVSQGRVLGGVKAERDHRCRNTGSGAKVLRPDWSLALPNVGKPELYLPSKRMRLVSAKRIPCEKNN
jgi:hypothetical protein